MQDQAFTRIAEHVRTGAGNEGLGHLLKSAARAAQTDTAFLALRTSEWTSVIASYQLPISLLGGWKSDPLFAEKFSHRFIDKNFWGGKSGAVSDTIYQEKRWNFVVNVPIHLPKVSGTVTLTCCDTKPPATDFSLTLPIVKNICTVISHYLRLIDQLTDTSVLNEKRIDPVGFFESQSEYAVADFVDRSESPMITGEFLVKTLVERRHICTRENISYNAIRQWRAAIKPYQIAALKALKRAPPASFIECVARELVQASLQIAGSNAFDAVVSVPCGHSGIGCFAEKLSIEVARQMGIPQEPVFNHLEIKGVSHPKANIGRPRMVCRKEPVGRYLVVDDVATSGSHITEATRLLRTAKSTAVPLVWISG